MLKYILVLLNGVMEKTMIAMAKLTKVVLPKDNDEFYNNNIRSNLPSHQKIW
jgi:hypothetical protein